MNQGMNYDRLNLIHEYTNEAQKELVNIPTSESNIIRQLRYIKETVEEISKDIGVKL